MRLIRLSDEDEHFPDIEAVHDYFQNPASPFRTRGQFATFIFNRHIRADGLHPGETLLFSYRIPGEEARVVYVATAWSGREDWTGPGSDMNPHCFRVNLATLRQTSFTIQQLAVALDVQLPASQGWSILPDNLRSEWAVNRLSNSP